MAASYGRLSGSDSVLSSHKFNFILVSGCIYGLQECVKGVNGELFPSIIIQSDAGTVTCINVCCRRVLQEKAPDMPQYT